MVVSYFIYVTVLISMLKINISMTDTGLRVDIFD